MASSGKWRDDWDEEEAEVAALQRLANEKSEEEDDEDETDEDDMEENDDDDIDEPEEEKDKEEVVKREDGEKCAEIHSRGDSEEMITSDVSSQQSPHATETVNEDSMLMTGVDPSEFKASPSHDIEDQRLQQFTVIVENTEVSTPVELADFEPPQSSAENMNENQIIVYEEVAQPTKLESTDSLPMIMDGGSVVQFRDIVFSNEAVDEGDNGRVYDPKQDSCATSMAESPTDEKTREVVEDVTDTAVSSAKPVDIAENEVVLLQAEEIGDDEEIPVSYHNAIILNQAYQCTISDKLASLEEQLQENSRRQAEVDQEIQILMSGGKSSSFGFAPSNKRSVNVFAVPYFKDVNLYSHPPNADTLAKRNNGELDVYCTAPREWTKEEQKRLTNAVREDAIRERCRALNERHAELEVRIRVSQFDGVAKQDTDDMREESRNIKIKTEEIAGLSNAELLQNRYESFDWMRISTQTFRGAVSAKQCELMWKNLLHPSIKRSSWTAREDEVLKRLAAVGEERYWDIVADELNKSLKNSTGDVSAKQRTAFLCFSRYQKKHKAEQFKRRWTKEEDDRLRKLVAMCRINNFVPWTKVAYYMDRRTKDQVYQRYVYSLRETLRKGAFTNDEDFVVMVGVKLFGHDWARIVDFMPHRTANQIHSRYNTFLKANFATWTTEENQRLLECVKMHGTKNWTKIAEEVGGSKTRTQCRNRFNSIYRKYLKNPDDFNLAKVKNSSLQSRRQDELHAKLDEQLDKFLRAQQAERMREDAQGVARSSYHVTPSGARIAREDLYEFLFELKEKLPSESTQTAYLDEHGGRMPKRRRRFTDAEISSLSVRATTGSCSWRHPLLALRKNARTGKMETVLTATRKGPGRPAVNRNTELSKKSRRLDRILMHYFRPAWVGIGKRKRGITARSYSEKEVDTLSSAAIGLGTILKCEKAIDFRSKGLNVYENMGEMKIQLIDAIKAKQGCVSGLIRSPQPVFRPSTAIRTYCRNNSNDSNQSKSFAPRKLVRGPQTTPSLKTVPPCHATLVGFRGLILQARPMFQTIDPKGNRQFKYRNDRDDTLRNGVDHPDFAIGVEAVLGRAVEEPKVYPTGTGHETGISTEKADELLLHRLRALFFWPSEMSKIKPVVEKQRNIFLDEDIPDNSTAVRRKISAVNPFDASDIIRAAQQMGAPKSRVRRVKQSRQIKMEEEDDAASLMPPPPPPPLTRKRKAPPEAPVDLRVLRQEEEVRMTIVNVGAGPEESVIVEKLLPSCTTITKRMRVDLE